MVKRLVNQRLENHLCPRHQVVHMVTIVLEKANISTLRSVPIQYLTVGNWTRNKKKNSHKTLHVRIGMCGVAVTFQTCIQDVSVRIYAGSFSYFPQFHEENDGTVLRYSQGCSPTHPFNLLVTHHFTTRHYTISITGSCILLIPYNMIYCRLPTAWCPWKCIAWFEKSAGRTHEHGQRACSDSRYWRGKEKNYIRLNFVIFTFHLAHSNHNRNKKMYKKENNAKTERLWNLKR